MDPSPSGIVFYSWDTTGCFVSRKETSCFPKNKRTQTVSEDGVLARDAGTVRCTVTTDSGSFTSEPFTLRISG